MKGDGSDKTGVKGTAVLGSTEKVKDPSKA